MSTAGQAMTGALEHQRDAADVVAPVFSRFRVLFVEVEFECVVHQERADAERAV